jgi:hypothetical protein
MSESTVFVVRVWQEAKPFRAAARAVDDDQTFVFSEPAELLRFLAPHAPRLTGVSAGQNSAVATTSQVRRRKSGQPGKEKP